MCIYEFLSFPRSSDSDHSSVYKEAVFILNSLSPLSIPEVIGTARALILPVCMGVARPFLPSLMNDKHKISEELFTLPSASLHRQSKSSSAPATVTEVGVANMGGVGEGVSDSESEVGEGEETHTHGDASSTATIGSGPIPFFSDQVSLINLFLDYNFLCTCCTCTVHVVLNFMYCLS